MEFNEGASYGTSAQEKDYIPQIYGYVRVSTTDQNPDRQLLEMVRENVPKKNIWVDKQSGKDFERPNYKRMMEQLRAGDLLVVKSIDRLGRNYEEIGHQWRIITKEKKADIRILDMPLLDTTASKDLLGTLISDIVLQLLSFVAQNERDNIRQRQEEGIRAAMAKGVSFGRPKRKMPPNFYMHAEAWRNGEISLRKAAQATHMSPSTFKDLVERYLSK